MGGGRLRASAGCSLLHPDGPSSFLRPLRHSCAGRNLHAPTPLPYSLPPIHPSPLPGGRLGGGWEVASKRRPLFLHPDGPSSFLRPLRHSCAGRNLRAPTPLPYSLPPIHPSPLPGGRLGGGWEVASQRWPLSPTPRSLLVIPAPPPSFLRRQEPVRLPSSNSPQPCYHSLEERKCDPCPPPHAPTCPAPPARPSTPITP